MTANIRIGSFNIGQGWENYSSAVNGFRLNDEIQKCLQELGYEDKKKRFDELTKDKKNFVDQKKVAEELEAIYKKAQETIYRAAEHKTILKLTEELDVICLQETLNGQRDFISLLNQQGFDYFVGPYNPLTRLYSTAIAVRRGTFCSLQNISTPFRENADRKIYGKQIAGLYGTVTGKNKTISVASLHNWSLQPFDPQDKNRKYTKNDLEDQKKHIRYLDNTLDHLNSYASDITILMGDLNNDPENYEAPFKMMEQEGFILKRVFQRTQFNSKKVRELDFGFIKINEESFFQSIAIFFASIFRSYILEKVEVTEAEIIPGFEFDIQKTCSDHLPIRFTVTIVSEKVPSKLSLLWKKIFS